VQILLLDTGREPGTTCSTTLKPVFTVLLQYLMLKASLLTLSTKKEYLCLSQKMISCSDFYRQSLIASEDVQKSLGIK